MEYYLSPYVGDGRNGNMFLPGNSEEVFHSIDLRGNCTRQEGWCFLASPVKSARAGSVYLGDHLDEEFPQAFRWQLESLLGIELIGKTLRRLIVETMFQGTLDGPRWKPLLPSGPWWKIYLGDEIFCFPVVRGGTSISESFNTGDSDTLGPDLSWTELVGDIDIVSNAASGTGDGTCARADSTLATADHFAQADVSVTGGDLTADQVGVMTRKDNSATITYYAGLADYVNGSARINKYVSGSLSGLSNDAATTSGTIVLKMTAVGTSLEVFYGGVSKSSITDSAIGGNTYVGITTRTINSTAIWDAFEAADIAAAGSSIVAITNNQYRRRRG